MSPVCFIHDGPPATAAATAQRKRLEALAQRMEQITARGVGKKPGLTTAAGLAGWGERAADRAEPTGLAPKWLAPWRLGRAAVHEWLWMDGAEGESAAAYPPLPLPGVGMRKDSGGSWASALTPALSQRERESDFQARAAPLPGAGARLPGVAPLCVLVDLAWAAMVGAEGAEGAEERDGNGAGSAGGLVVWVGRAVWPHPRVMLRGGAHDTRLIAQSLLVDTGSSGNGGQEEVARRVWAIELALRCARRVAGVAAVVADGRGLDSRATRRLQLAAEAGGGLALLARPWRERSVRSAAGTRWCVRPHPTDSSRPCWALTLLRARANALARQGSAPWACTDGQGTPAPAAGSLHSDVQPTFLVQWHEQDGLIPVSAELADRSHPPAPAAPPCLRAGPPARPRWA